MKKLSLILIVFLISLSGIAQQGSQDVIYLKNGTIVRGKIIEQVPNQSIKVYTASRTIAEFKMDEIEKMEKEQGGGALISSTEELPISQGNIIVGGGGTIDYYKSKTDYGVFTSEYKRTAISLYPTFLYFVTDGLAIGATLDLGLSLHDKKTDYTLGIGPEIRYYFEAGLLLKAETSYVFQSNMKDGYLSVKPGIGYAIFINSKVALEPCLVYEFTSEKWKSGTNNITDKANRFGIEIGFSKFF